MDTSTTMERRISATRWILFATGLASLAPTGCHDARSGVQTDGLEAEAYVRLLMPRSIQVQRHLTRPITFAGDERAEGVEVILAAFDSQEDKTKVVGTFHIELYTMRMASGDRLGERLAFWEIAVDSEELMLKYWDRLSRFYRFPLRLEGVTLKPGRYILTVRLITPTGDKLFDEYEFTYEEEARAPTGSP